VSNYIIETKSLTKQYGSQKTVADLNIHVKQGRIYGLLGRNGAGKTTTMKMLLGLTRPTSGEVKIWGKTLQGNEKKLLPRIGSLIEAPGFYPNLTATENLRIFATLRGVPNLNAIKDSLNLVGLPYKDKKLFSQYSLGMKQRLGLALALMNNPEILLLDEPINGLDPFGIVEIRNLLLKLNQEKKITILISSHILSELSNLVTRYGFIHNGSLIKQLSQEELMKECSQYLEVKVDQTEKLTALLESELGCTSYSVTPDYTIQVYDYLDKPAIISELAVRHGIGLNSINTKEVDLEQYFIQLAGGIEDDFIY